MLGEVVRVRLAVALDVRQAAGFGRVGPPIIAVGIEVVGPTLTEPGAERGDGQWFEPEGSARRFQDAVAVCGGHVQAGPVGEEQLQALV